MKHIDVKSPLIVFITFMIVGIAVMGCDSSDKQADAESADLYQCTVCKLHFTDKEWADKCIAWCKEYNSCNLEIMRYSEEASQ